MHWRRPPLQSISRKRTVCHRRRILLIRTRINSKLNERQQLQEYVKWRLFKVVKDTLEEAKEETCATLIRS